MDTSLVVWLNGLAQDQPLHAAAVAAANVMVLVEAALVAALCVGALRRRDTRAVASVLIAAAATLVGLACNVVATSVWMRPRPYHALADVHALTTPNAESSFFSDHVVVATGLAIAAVLLSKRWGGVAVGCAVVVAVGRVAVGAHYPSDTLVAALVTVAAALVLLPLRPWLSTIVGKVLRLSEQEAARS